MEVAAKQIRTTPRPRCFLCGAEGKPLYENLRPRLFDAPGLWNFKLCLNLTCGLVWLDPMPVPEDLPLAYQNYFTHGQDGNSRPTLRDALYRAYKAGSFLPATIAGLQSAREERTKMFLDNADPGKLLDVGCGDGQFLRLMRRAGWIVDGVDFDRKAIENAKIKYGLELHHGDLASVRFPASTFDAITMSHVIEHVPDPLALLKECRRILKPGGRLIAATPNVNSLGHHHFGSCWLGLDPPRHLHLFSPITLTQLGVQAGFHRADTWATAANAQFFAEGSLSIARTGRHRFGARMTPGLVVRSLLFQFRAMIAHLARRDSGEECVLDAVK